MSLTLVLFLIGILLRHGRSWIETVQGNNDAALVKTKPKVKHLLFINTLCTKTPVYSLEGINNFPRGSGLNAAIISNEVWSWGSTKWEKGSWVICHRIKLPWDRGPQNRDRMTKVVTWRQCFPSTLPSSTVWLGRRQLNSHYKNGSAILSEIPLKLKSEQTGINRFWDVCLWVHPAGYAITENEPGTIISGSKPNLSICKHGNPGKWQSYKTNTPNCELLFAMSQKKTCNWKYRRDGGKILEEANAKGNALDTQSKRLRTYRSRGRLNVLLNSICRTEVALVPWGSGHIIQDLPVSHRRWYTGARLMSTSPDSLAKMRELVEGKQKELVRLAKLKGVYDKSVLDRQILMARSKLFRMYAAKMISIKKGSQTPGIDKEHFDKDNDKALPELAQYLRDVIYHPNKYRASAVKRVWIPEPGKKEERPIGIPTIKDRALQALVNLVLMPLVELTSDPNSYGFRPYRDCKMAIAAVRSHLKSLDVEKRAIKIRGAKKGIEGDLIGGNFMKANQDKWIFDGGIKGFFDNINHEWIMKNIFLHKDLKVILHQWLKARIFDKDTYTVAGATPQGGIISPTLANFTLNGLEKVAKESIFKLTKNQEQILIIKLSIPCGDRKDNKLERVRLALPVQLIRYADDFIIITRSKNLLKKYISPAVDTFLKERGLWLSPQKTKQYSLRQPGAQLDFLGYTFKFQEKWSSTRSMRFAGSWGIALYPNRDKVKAFARKLKEEFQVGQNLSAMELISKLNPIIRGWANYYNLENSSRYRSVIRQVLYRLTWKWMRTKHPTLGKKTLAKMYFLRKEETTDEQEPNCPIAIANKKEVMRGFKGE